MDIAEPEFLEAVQVGSAKIPGSVVFVKTKHSCAFVAPNPILPGRILFCTEYKKPMSDSHWSEQLHVSAEGSSRPKADLQIQKIAALETYMESHLRKLRG